MVRPSFVFLFVSCPFVFRVHRLTPRFRHPSAHALRSPVAHRDAASDRLPAPPFPITGYGRHAPPMPLTGGAHPRPWLTDAARIQRLRAASAELEIRSHMLGAHPSPSPCRRHRRRRRSRHIILRNLTARTTPSRLRAAAPIAMPLVRILLRRRSTPSPPSAGRRREKTQKERCGGQPYRMSAAP